MKKNDLQSLILSLVINFLIILILPNIDIKRDAGKISVGLIQFKEENKKVTPKKNLEKKKAIPKKKVKDVKEKPKVNDKKVEKKVEKKQVKPIETPSSEGLFSDFDPITTTAIVPARQVATSKKKVVKREAGDIGVKQDIKGVSSVRESSVAVVDEKIESVAKKEDIVVEGESSTEGKSNFEAIASGTNKAEGLPKGYKIGFEDGDMVGIWDPGNTDPDYSYVAQKKGQQGKVVIRLQINKDGRVEEARIIEKSGYSEIDNSVERIARTWRIRLVKFGQNIYGTADITISFKLKRGE